MDKNTFDKVVEARLQKISSVLGSKAKEYARADRFYNLKRAAEIMRTTPEHALLGMWSKHLVSVIDLIEGTLPATVGTIDEKIGDAINYLILLEGMLLEKINAACPVAPPLPPTPYRYIQPTDNFPCPNCAYLATKDCLPCINHGRFTPMTGDDGEPIGV